jgi:hypothetical protein
MKCPYLQGMYFQSCHASKEVYIPSQFEFKEYCTHGGHRICSFFTKAEYDGFFANDSYIMKQVLSVSDDHIKE